MTRLEAINLLGELLTKWMSQVPEERTANIALRKRTVGFRLYQEREGKEMATYSMDISLLELEHCPSAETWIKLYVFAEAERSLKKAILENW